MYVLPCSWEDHCKVGFSRDPLSRLQDLHRRWFDVFDLSGIALVEAETVRDARDIELALRAPLREHRAPPPSTVRSQAGGETEWLRGALQPLACAIDDLERRGHTVHAPATHWLRSALLERSDQLYAWTLAQLARAPGGDALQHALPDAADAWRVPPDAPARVVRDTLDAYAALGIDVEPWIAVDVQAWYRAGHA